MKKACRIKDIQMTRMFVCMIQYENMLLTLTIAQDMATMKLFILYNTILNFF